MKIGDLKEVTKLDRELHHLKYIQEALSHKVLLENFQVAISQLGEDFVQVTSEERQEAILSILRAEIDARVTETENALNCLL